jgi:transcriptional regulator with XRE-family HTH domain
MIALANDKRSRERAGAVFRAVRVHQRRRSVDIADAMGVSPRTYQSIEAGSAQVEIGEVESFARATGVDVFSLFVAILCNTPSVAVRSAENKMMLIAGLEMADFIDGLGPMVEEVRPHQVLRATETLKRLLAKEFDAIQRGRSWLAGRSAPKRPSRPPDNED